MQLVDWPLPATRATLGLAGIVLHQPLTGRAYLTTVSRTVLTSKSPVPGIRWVGPLQPADKLSVELRRADGARWARRSPGQTDVVVKLFADGELAPVISRVQQLGGKVLGQAPLARTLSATLPSGREQDLAALDDVRLIEPLDPPGQSESDRVRQHVNATVGPLPIGSPNGQGVIVGVFDYRHADVNHPDFGARAARGDAGAAAAPDIHPTMTAGMIAGDGSSSQSQPGALPGARAASASQWRGVAPGATIRSYNYSDGGDSATNYINDVTDAVINDAVVIANNSWGTSGCTDFAYGSYAGRVPFLDGVVHGDLGRRVAVVFSAGNERDGFNAPENLSCIVNGTAPFANYGTLNHPKTGKNVLVVGAVDSANNAMSSYSSWGPTLDGRLKPDVVASGHHNGALSSGITSITLSYGNPYGAANQQGYRVPAFPRDPGQYWYGWFTQTSSAAAVASGTLALLVHAWRTAFPAGGDPLPSTLRALLTQNAVDLNDATTWYNRGPDFASGYGLIHVSATVASLQRGDVREGSIDANGSVPFRVNVAASTTVVTFTLAWDDPPATEAANPALVNDLDLIVTDPPEYGTIHGRSIGRILPPMPCELAKTTSTTWSRWSWIRPCCRVYGR